MQLSVYETFKATLAILLSYRDSESWSHALFAVEHPTEKAFSEQIWPGKRDEDEPVDQQL